MSDEKKIPVNPPCTFGINQSFDTFDSGWRTFPGHYLLYASSGTFHLEVDNARWLLPPQRAAWVAAQVPIRVKVDGPVTCSSVLFTEASMTRPEFACRIFAVSTLAREMLLYAILANSPTFEDVAKAVHVSERTLARRFTEETNMTWRQFVRRARMIRAMELLAEPATKVIEVVYAVGFSSVSAFNHAFREFTGETPSSYRKRFLPM